MATFFFFFISKTKYELNDSVPFLPFWISLTNGLTNYFFFCHQYSLICVSMFSLEEITYICKLLKHCGFSVLLATLKYLSDKSWSGSFLPSAGAGAVELFHELDSRWKIALCWFIFSAEFVLLFVLCMSVWKLVLTLCWEESMKTKNWSRRKGESNAICFLFVFSGRSAVLNTHQL